MVFKKLVFICLLSGLFFSASEQLLAQRASRQVRQAEKRQERQEKVERRDYEKERKRLAQEHFDRQTPAVQERMKQNERENRRMKQPTKPPFYKRWFRKKPN